MPNKKQSRSRIDKFSTAETLEWRRCLENPALKREIRAIQLEFGLPLQLKGKGPLIEDSVYKAWMGWRKDGTPAPPAINNRRKRLVLIARALVGKYGVKPQYFGSLWNLLVTGDESPSYRTGGFPTFTIQEDKNGGVRPVCIVTMETDLQNPLVLATMRTWQRKGRIGPPAPVQVGRTKDWRPVWEWRNRNPGVSHLEIARMLGLHRVTVSRSLGSLDKANAPGST